jgi:hypothetical protein
MLFVGGTVMTFDPPLLDSATGEIAGLIGLYRLKLLGARWMLATGELPGGARRHAVFCLGPAGAGAEDAVPV